ncbi:hypothetical protein CDAR_305641 [Caerostris darwini]|uniref:Uncharacterized protein n=1 Tax=Caerostris darwini TaxID=1538125 RepID=A0AAV4P5N6_9ARAC|nr:hypothetical protein CDAR_305641 [Caerostris darwini]
MGENPALAFERGNLMKRKHLEVAGFLLGSGRSGGGIKYPADQSVGPGENPALACERGNLMKRKHLEVAGLLLLLGRSGGVEWVDGKQGESSFHEDPNAASEV